MLSRKSQIIKLDKVQECIKFAINSNNLVCIGVDGPTASGKTIFAEILKEEITNKDVQLVPLDSLLVERSFREKSLLNIKNVGIPFEHEAEIHMRFSKFEELLYQVNLKKENLLIPISFILRISNSGKFIGLAFNSSSITIIAL